jgi:predicted DnaQ family exonuclease/DinG family helicase
MDKTYVALDLEFTGLDPQRDEIIEIGMVRFRGDEVLETFSSLVNPGRPIPYKIQLLSGISPDEVRAAPSLQSLRGTILAFVRSYPVVGHSVDIDLRYLSRCGLAFNNLPIDTFELASILLPQVDRYSLANLSDVLNIDMSDHHRALSDAMATKDLFLSLVERALQWPPETLEEIARVAQGSNWPLAQVFRDLANERASKRGLKLLLGGGNGQRNETPFFALPKETEFPPLEPKAEPVPVDAAHLASLLEQGGLFSRQFAKFEYRPQQVEMLRQVSEAFNTPDHVLVEAGTGTGKSMAYLLPAIYYAASNGRRVVISTNTINLQEQLFNKDIPDLQRILPIEFRAALLKGRSNYLCMRRLAAFRRSRQFNQDEARVLAKVLAWLPITQTGDRSELVMTNPDRDVWTNIQAASESCMGDTCPFRRKGDCFFYRARARAERAHLVIVNHALLLSDLALGNRILPEYTHLIIDEAHHLEEQATDQFGFEIGQRDLYAFLNNLSHQSGDMPGGLLSLVPGLLQGDSVSNSARQAIIELLQTLHTTIDNAQRRLYELFNVLTNLMSNHDMGKSQGPYDQPVPITSGVRSQPDWSVVEITWEGFAAPLRELVRDLERLVGRLENLDVENPLERDELAQDLKAQVQLGNEMWDNLDQILTRPKPEGIYWISISGRDQELTLCSAPLHVGPMLQERLFAEKECVVLTSATLQTDNSFHYIKGRLGLEDPLELAVDSPFDFKSSVLLYVPKDIPEPSEPYYQKTVEKAIVDLCRATEGRTLLLFTSNSQLNSTYRAIQRPLEEDGIVVYGQGLDGSRRQILESFRSTDRAVLLGTRSFWEGVDVVGQALSCLVITRLPFAVPNDPVLSARAATFDDPFNQFYLPDSILRFRQGFGRLIRSAEDYGLVVVLDKRILTKPYGKTILRSLPPCTARQGPLERLPILARRWLDPENRS